uniref:Uncharacterized protein n=1 Tax=Fundulus heteroclitus TaxID=8078 RepID=A0A3Q2NSH9_FUNHE
MFRTCSEQGQNCGAWGGGGTTRKREDYLEWPEYFMAVAFLSAQRSKDPSSQNNLGSGYADPPPPLHAPRTVTYCGSPPAATKQIIFGSRKRSDSVHAGSRRNQEQHEPAERAPSCDTIG